MKIDPGPLDDLKQLCAKHLQRELSDAEAQDIGQRIVRFLRAFERCPAEAPDVDAN